jgi:sialic acid synthase SpsE
MISDIRLVESALGNGEKIPRGPEIDNIPIGRKSLHWRRPLPAGAVVAVEDLIALRPGIGIPPGHRDSLIGHRTARAVAVGTLIQDADLQA